MAALIAITTSDGVDDAKEWDKYKEIHHCRLVAVKDSSSDLTTGVSLTGKPYVGTTYNSAQEGWECDDGVTYWKNK